MRPVFVEVADVGPCEPNGVMLVDGPQAGAWTAHRVSAESEVELD